jgi:hypothetical protein
MITVVGSQMSTHLTIYIIAWRESLFEVEIIDKKGKLRTIKPEQSIIVGPRANRSIPCACSP